MKLSVTLTRDKNWRSVANNDLRASLLYIGVDFPKVQKLLNYHQVGLSLSAPPVAFFRPSDPIELSSLIRNLYDLGILPDFFTEMLKLRLIHDLDTLKTHLRPLGLDVDIKNKRVVPTTTRPEAELELRSVLEVKLAKINPEFPRMLNGAWDAYYSNNANKYRNTISSCRELLNQFITKLSKGGLTRKERIRFILGSKSETELVEAVAELVDQIYSVQSAQEHTSPDRATALFVLAETEHVLHFLLSHVDMIAKGSKGV
jgi:hypothetical protein